MTRHAGGRPRVYVDVERAVKMRADGHSWPHVARELGVSRRSLRRYVAAVDGAANAEARAKLSWRHP